MDVLCKAVPEALSLPRASVSRNPSSHSERDRHQAECNSVACPYAARKYRKRKRTLQRQHGRRKKQRCRYPFAPVALPKRLPLGQLGRVEGEFLLIE